MQHVKWLKLFIYTLVNSTPSIYAQARPNGDKNSVSYPKILPELIEFYTGIPVVPVTNSMSDCLPASYISVKFGNKYGIISRWYKKETKSPTKHENC